MFLDTVVGILRNYGPTGIEKFNADVVGVNALTLPTDDVRDAVINVDVECHSTHCGC